MKKLTLFSLLLLCLAGVSCKDDYLVTTDPTRIGADLFYQNQTQFEQAVNGVYGQLQTITNTAYLFTEFNTDNTTLDFNPLDRGGAAGWEAFEFSTVNPGNGEIANLWNQHYSTLYNINYALEKLAPSTIDANAKKEIEGQLKFLRGYHYFNLARYFGDVVLVTSTLKNPDQAFDLVRSPQAAVYTQVENDLKEAAALLPASRTKKVGWANKGAALTLLGKLYLTKKQYAEAVSTLKQVVPLGYSLLPKYADIFDPAKKNGPESIFEVQYQGGNDLGEQSNFMYVFAPRLSQGAVTGFANTPPGGRNIPTNDIMAAFEPGDLRKDVSFQPGYTLNGTFVAIPFINKYRHPHTITGRTDNNWPVLRYADVLLMLAEAINEQAGPTAEAADFVNQVRKRAGLKELGTLSKDAFREAVLKERRVELAFENHRWFDLQRTKTPAELAAFLNTYGAKEKANPTVGRGGIAFNALDYVYSDFEYFLPIPAPQILINSKLTQNAGY
ncbi:RagB/SusD family nutrient uptake outer membrane protein [Rudanella paleaurantiibacter]|uniref:RagB/SusD family nutrient uptake outer membrane protein n=1 Tax=Rudanella paleaurantiibacter TaxID=2614655 RepID=A0A7J5U339_9BACT|nr:RagB/SusD family nutrient uptake outer membrane protein [Rudanella paleaurantiibacter]KAB7732224.1 RagB/SusD family nutrient uptake outer membrane protein [Rudanella paleaurantiibacter]